MNRRSLEAPRRLLLAWGISLLAAACDSPTAGRPGSSYVLQSVDGALVPAATDTVDYRGDDGVRRRVYSRITYRAVDFVSRDSLWYTYETDEGHARADGTIASRNAFCTAMRVRYRRIGDRLVLDIDPNVFNPGWLPPRPVLHDTLVVSGDRLIQRIRRWPSAYRPFPRTIRLVYEPGPVRTPRCG